jgi:hypothetical protein
MGPGGSALRGKSRTALAITFYANAVRSKANHLSRLGYSFDGTHLFFTHPKIALPKNTAKVYRNPIALAREWQRALSDTPNMSGANLARRLGVSRARISQVLRLLDLAPEAVGIIVAFGDPLPAPIVTERSLRVLIGLPIDEQIRAAHGLAFRSDAERKSPRR